MIIAAENRGVPMTLRFYGGLFQPVPGLGKPFGMDVHFGRPESVRVEGAEGEHTRFERVLSRALRVDIVGSTRSSEPLRLPERPWARSLSHVLPIDSRAFRKTVAFRGGTLWGHLDPGTLEAERATYEKEGNAAFQRWTGLSTGGTNDPYLALVQEAFHRQVERGALEPWIPGYSVDVALQVSRIVVDGDVDDDVADIELPYGATLGFAAAPGSHLPHFPANNPHVLEQPPTT